MVGSIGAGLAEAAYRPSSDDLLGPGLAAVVGFIFGAGAGVLTAMVADAALGQERPTPVPAGQKQAVVPRPQVTITVSTARDVERHVLPTVSLVGTF